MRPGDSSGGSGSRAGYVLRWIQAAVAAGSIGVRVIFMPGLSRSSSRILARVWRWGFRELYPEHAGTIAGVLAVPSKKHGRRFRLLPHRRRNRSPARRPGHRDLARPPRPRPSRPRRPAPGLRSSELTGLTRGDVQTGTGPNVRCHGKGRKDRITLLTANVATVIRSWLREQPGDPGDPLFPARTGRRLSSDAVQDLVSNGTPRPQQRAARPSRASTSPRTPSVTPGYGPAACRGRSRHHRSLDGAREPRSTQPYIHADLKLKEKALARTALPKTTTGRYRPPDKLLAFLEGLGLCRSLHTRANAVARAFLATAGIIAVSA